MIRRTALTSAAILVVTGAAAAQGAQPGFYVDLVAGAGSPLSTFAGAAPSPGTWNVLPVDLAPGPVYLSPPLVDTNGGTTAVRLQWVTQNASMLGLTFNAPFTSGDDAALMDDAGYAFGPSTFNFLGLPPGTYDVITYAMAPSNPLSFTSVSVVGSAEPAQDVGGDFSLGYVLGVTHAFHTVVVAAGQPLSIDVDVAVSIDTINGIQVFPSGGGALGTSYCEPAVANSSGAPAQITLTGSPVVSVNSLALSCDSMPMNSFGFFLVSSAQGFVANPGGSVGNLCLSGAIGRYVGPGQVQNSGTAGSISLNADLTMLPQPTGFIAVQAGDTWNFTTWFRDSIAGTATSNFSQGVELVFL